MPPITNGIAVVSTALYAALSPLVGTYQGVKKAYYLQAEQGAPHPFLIFQPQAPGVDASLLNNTGYEGLWTIRALASTPAGADVLIAGVDGAVSAVTAAGGYSFSATFERDIAPPPLDNVWQSGLIYRVRLFV